MTAVKSLVCVLTLLLFCSLHVLAAESPGRAAATAYVVYDYRYDPAGSGGDPDTGHSLCANRCNALSFDYADYLMADARELRRIASDRELTVPLDNPFMKGNCICTVDEYLIKPNTRNQPRQPESK